MKIKNIFSVLTLTLSLGIISFTNQAESRSLPPFYAQFLNSLNDSPQPMVDCLENCLFECSNKSKYQDHDLGCADPCLKTCEKKHRDILTKKKNTLKDLSKNYCLNKKNPDNMSRKEMLLEFAKGPCSPVMLLPGILGTRLVVEINCEELRKHEPETFKACGWDACEKDFYEFWKDVPNKEYLIWIPEILSPMSFFSFFKQKNICFSHLVTGHFHPDKSPEEKVSNKKGIKIKVYGTTKETKNDSCGGDAISDLLSMPMQIAPTKGYREMIEALQHIGYVAGLTYQPVPYNFNVSYKVNEVSRGFQAHLRRLKHFTGKKTTVVAHSMGNLNALYNLSRMDVQTKNDLVLNFVSLNPPYLGADMVASVFAGGNDDNILLHKKFGLHYEGSVNTTSNQHSLFQMMPKDFYRLYENEEVLQRIQKRMKYEEEYPKVLFEDSGIPFWPSLNRVCYDKTLETFSSKCKIGLYNTKDHVIVKIGSFSRGYRRDQF